jgi:REP element-mobilizing transposase RayT
MPFWRLFYHFVWSTKDRIPLIDEQIEAELYRVIAAKAQELGAIVHAIGGIEDHVHLAASVPPKVSLSEFVGLVKGNSSHFVNHVIKPDFHFTWQEEYGVQSFSEKSLPAVVSYIKNQRHHHQDGKTWEKLERTD